MAFPRRLFLVNAEDSFDLSTPHIPTTPPIPSRPPVRTTTALISSRLYPPSEMPSFKDIAANFATNTLKPDFSRTETAELHFKVLTTLDLDEGKDEMRDGIIWFPAARAYVYPLNQVKTFIQNEEQNSCPGVRFVMNVDTSINISRDGVPDKETAAHGQASKHNNKLSITSGIFNRRIEDGVMIITGGNNQSSYFQSDFQKQQLALIAIMESDEYQRGEIRFENDNVEMEFLDADPAGRKTYTTTSGKLILRLKELSEIYEDTILSAENRQRYAEQYTPITWIETAVAMTPAKLSGGYSSKLSATPTRLTAAGYAHFTTPPTPNGKRRVVRTPTSSGASSSLFSAFIATPSMRESVGRSLPPVPTLMFNEEKTASAAVTDEARILTPPRFNRSITVRPVSPSAVQAENLRTENQNVSNKSDEDVVLGSPTKRYCR